MQLEVLLVVFVIIAAVAVGIQSFFMIKVSRSLASLTEHLDHRLEELGEEAQEVMNRFRGVAENLEPLGKLAESIGANGDMISKMVEARVQDVDQFLKEMLHLRKEQAAKIDYVVTDTVQKFEQTTETIQKDVLDPAFEVSSFLKGIKTGIGYFFQSKDRATSRGDHPPEEENLFI